MNESLRRVDARDLAAIGRGSPFVIDEQACWLVILETIWCSQAYRQMMWHFGGCGYKIAVAAYACYNLGQE